MTGTETVTPGRHETPTARLITHADAPRAEWLAARTNGITATDVVAIMALSHYKTAYDVWADKTMPAPEGDDELGEAAIWGMRLEEPVAQEWAHRHGLRIRRVGLVANETHPWAMASLDRIVHGCGNGRCALEVKTRNLFVQSEWERALPADVEAQARWQLLVTGLDHIHVAALIGGQRLVEHLVERDQEAEDKLLAAARIVWDAVQAQTPPDMPAELWTSDLLDQRHPTREGEVEVGPDVVEALEQYNATVTAIKQLEDEKAMYRTLLVGSLGDHETATSDGRTVYSYKSQTSRRLDQKALAEHHPYVAGDTRVWNTTTTRILRVTARKGNTTNE